MQPCGGCWGARRLLVAPAAVGADDQSMVVLQEHIEKVVSVTTTLLFAAFFSYMVFCTVYACILGALYNAGQQELDAPPREDTKRALERIPVRVVVLCHPRDATGGRPDVVVEDKGEGDQDCAVCLAEYAAGDEVRVLPACSHGFHRECVDRWLLTRAPTCPVCRAPVTAHLDGADVKKEEWRTARPGTAVTSVISPPGPLGSRRRSDGP